MQLSETLSPAAQEAWSRSFFASLPAGASEGLLATAVEIDAPSGHVIYRELVRPTDAFLALVVTGLLRVYVSSPGGREITVHYCKSGDVVGLPSLVAQGAPSGVQAITQSRMVRVQVNALRHLGHTNPEVAWAIAEKLTDLMFEVVSVLSDNVFRSVRERVAGALIEMSKDEGGTPTVRATQSEIADAIGSVREVVSRTLSQMRDEGLIDRRGGRIIIRDLPAVARIVKQESTWRTTSKPASTRSG